MTQAIKKVTKQMIIKEDQKIFDRGGQPLLDLQKSFASDLEWYFKKIYDGVVEVIKNDVQFTVEIKKYADEAIWLLDDYTENIIKTLWEWTILWMIDLNTEFIKTSQVEVAMGINNQFAVDRATEHAGEMIGQVTATTQKE